MVAEWGVWSSKQNPGHKADFYREVGEQIGRFPKIRAMVHFDTPHNQKGQDSRVDSHAGGPAGVPPARPTSRSSRSEVTNGLFLRVRLRRLRGVSGSFLIRRRARVSRLTRVSLIDHS